MTKVVLTTGANSGIGLATALELAKQGWSSVGSVRSEAKAELLHEAAANAGVEVGSVLFDVTDAAGCGRAVDEVVNRYGRLDGLVNNAGYGSTAAIEDVSDAEARQVLETMVIAPARLARLALPIMREQGGGTIVNISSIYGRATTPLSGWYQAAKHALEGWSDALRMEVAAEGIRVVLVEPGGFKTGIWDEVEHAGDEHEGSRYAAAYRRARQTIELSTPLMGRPESCAKVVAHALGSRAPRARYLVGPDAYLLAAVTQVTPTSVADRITRLVMGL
ncbi:MAG TPA: SDR family NAD(P)-dependent oxidoreductase [Acidimicrobiales bacterium]|nr:SDR family NAD(P)-dependent oxidoreductase [Acidimicrobiales bacterium]